MRFTTATIAAVLFGASALAAPVAENAARQEDDTPFGEDVTITDFFVHRAGYNATTLGVVDGVSFKLSGDNATDLSCSATATEITTGLPTEVITCGETKYRFAVLAGPDESTYDLRVYHELGIGAGFYGEGDVSTYCHSGGLDNIVCHQVDSPFVLRIDSL